MSSGWSTGLQPRQLLKLWSISASAASQSATIPSRSAPSTRMPSLGTCKRGEGGSTQHSIHTWRVRLLHAKSPVLHTATANDPGRPCQLCTRGRTASALVPTKN